MRRFQRSLLSLTLPGVLALLALAAMLSVARSHARQLSATYARGRLSVTIPYHAAISGPGRLVAEVLDPEDHILGRVERTMEVAKGDGSWQELITPERPIPFENIVWQRLRFRFEYAGNQAPPIEGIESISEILRRPIVRILGQTEYLVGSRAAIRIIVSDENNNSIAETYSQPGTLRVDLVAPDENRTNGSAHGKDARLLFSGRLEKSGTVEAQFRFPAGLTGKYELRFVADTAIGSTEYLQPIELSDKPSVLLATEKPIYQPGQTIHVRALALDRADHKAESNRPLTFEVEDSRGNKVFRKSTETDSFGIASAEFPLADEVNLGTYHLRALIGNGPSQSSGRSDSANSASTNTTEIALNVERYVLPKFKVAIEFAQKDNKPRSDYRPGDHVTGTVRANYFFGKPVDHAEVTVKASGMDVAVFEAASVTAKTDSEGAYRFDLKLPGYFAGRPLNQGAAPALVEATVKDSAAHSETRGEPITISESSLLITAVPEGGTLVPHIENQVFLLSSYPDGTPARAALHVHIPGSRDQDISTGSSGVAVIGFNPGSDMESLEIDADDHHGNRTTSNVPVQTRSGEDQLLLRTDRAVVKAGERMQLSVLSTRPRGTAYIDIVKNGQTVLTRDVDLQNGQADLTVNATPDMAGTLDIHAYLFGRDAQAVADHRLVFVEPASELKIETSADSAIYKPGADARIHFHVTNSKGVGVSAALGLQIVDEAVFALAERQPGFAKVFFYLEQELMKPRYEIHSLSMPALVDYPVGPVPLGESEKSQNDQRELAARALFSATEMASPARLDTEFGRSLPQDKYAEYAQRYHDVFIEQVNRIAVRLSKELSSRPGQEDIALDQLVSAKDPRDSWNTPFRIETANWNSSGDQFYLVRSAGPDRKFDSPDDLTVYIEEIADRSGSVVREAQGNPGQGGSIDLKIEHERGPFNGRAEVTGTVNDQAGAVIPGATIKLRLLSGDEIDTVHADASGNFNFAGLRTGRYEVSISSAGFSQVFRHLVLQERDRAVLSATLPVGSSTTVVMVSAENAQLATENGGLREMLASGGDQIDQQVMNRAGMVFAPTATKMAREVSGSPIQGRNFTLLTSLAGGTASATPHVRSYFPEALYINPEIITDSHGDASISIPVADSITTWRMALLASTRSGALGTGTSSLKVFQDFFVDLDLPVTLTQGDRVSIPIAVYNYSGKSGSVSLKLQPDDWFSLDNDNSEKSLAVESGRVGSSQFTINANRIGKFKLTLSAHMDGETRSDGRDDIVVREIEVIPNGSEQDLVFNGRLDGGQSESVAQHDLHFPANAIPDATSVLVRIYPGPLSQIIEGMDSILRMPGGCFEQTSSSTYPNVLALDYMKRTKKLTPEVHAKAEGYIANGYQRLLTFEVPGGGFSWFGQAPANKILTAYGLMEFHDMSRVSDVDPRLIQRTGDWLANQQQPDGSWKPDNNFINEGATNRYNSDVLRITAYLAWSLANTGYQGPAVEKAKIFIESHSASHPDAYTLAVIANFAVEYGQDRDFTRRSMHALLEAGTEKGDRVFWTADETGVYSTGESAAIETTGLAAQALLKWGQASGPVRKALTFIASKKQAGGDWGTTQATIMALRAILLAAQSSNSDVSGSVAVILNGKPVETLKLTPGNNDIFHQFAFKGLNASQSNSVQIKFEGAGGLAYQVVGRYFSPWDEKPNAEPLSINVSYDRTRLAQNDVATATTTIRNNLALTANMVMVDLGIPPGFDLLTEDLQAFQDKSAAARTGRLEKFSLTSTQAILYFNALAPNQAVTIAVRMRAKYPVRAHTFHSRVYEYYDPAKSATARPIQLEVSTPAVVSIGAGSIVSSLASRGRVAAERQRRRAVRAGSCYRFQRRPLTSGSE